MGPAPPEHQPGRHRPVQRFDGLLRQRISFDRFGRTADEEHQPLVQRQPELAPRRVARHCRNLVEIETDRNDRGRHRCGKKLLHPFGHDNHGVGATGDELAHPLEKAAAERHAAIVVLDSLNVAAVKGDDEGQTPGPGEQRALPELCVDQVERLLPQAGLEPRPGAQIVHRLSCAAERKDLDLDAGAAEKIDLAHQVRHVKRTLGCRPLAGDHQDAERSGHAELCINIRTCEMLEIWRICGRWAGRSSGVGRLYRTIETAFGSGHRGGSRLTASRRRMAHGIEAALGSRLSALGRRHSKGASSSQGPASKASKSQEPRAETQEPRAESRKPARVSRRLTWPARLAEATA